MIYISLCSFLFDHKCIYLCISSTYIYLHLSLYSGIFGLDGEVYRHKGTLTLEVLPRSIRVVVSDYDIQAASAAKHPDWAQGIHNTTS